MTLCKFRIRVVLYAAIPAILVVLGRGPRLYAQGRHGVSLSSTNRNLPFSDGIVAGHTLYIAGEQGTDAHGKLEVGISAQTRAALGIIRRIALKAGFSMDEVVSVNVYLSDVHDFAAMNKVYTTFFRNPKPARTTIQAAALVNGAKVEISAIAVRE
ncbi:MAG TPA: RidA family protein [Terriglobia bacterium]|nr:RidA family protein [Terriglobia bacterium]